LLPVYWSHSNDQVDLAQEVPSALAQEDLAVAQQGIRAEGGLALDIGGTIGEDFTSEEIMTTAHIRVGVKRSGKRINDRGNAGATICGAELTSYDVTLADARKLTRDQILDPRFPVCQMCLAKMPAEW
jgi:hypothetical protein